MQQEGAIPKGVWFKVLTPRNDASLVADHRGRVSKILYDLGRKGMFLESALYQFFRVKDPVTCEQIAAAIEEKKKTGKYPRLFKFEVVSADLTAACKFLSDGMGSNIYSAISNWVFHTYTKHRWKILLCWERLPFISSLHFRVRNNCLKLRLHPENENWFQIGFTPYPGDDFLWLNIRTPRPTKDPASRGDYTFQWLRDCVNGTGKMSQAVFFQRTHRGRKEWRVSLMRPQYEGEHEQVDPIADRWLVMDWPESQADPDGRPALLSGTVSFENGRPWTFYVRCDDLQPIKRRYEQNRRSMGEHYHWSEGGSHGHGRNRAIRGRDRLAEGWNYAQDNACKQMAAGIVREAVKMRCSGVKWKKLNGRDPQTLLLGSFPYYELQKTVEQKSQRHGLKFSEWGDYENFDIAASQVLAGS